jgi:hypothetical protein
MVAQELHRPRLVDPLKVVEQRDVLARRGEDVRACRNKKLRQVVFVVEEGRLKRSAERSGVDRRAVDFRRVLDLMVHVGASVYEHLRDFEVVLAPPQFRQTGVDARVGDSRIASRPEKTGDGLDISRSARLMERQAILRSRPPRQVVSNLVRSPGRSERITGNATAVRIGVLSRDSSMPIVVAHAVRRKEIGARQDNEGARIRVLQTGAAVVRVFPVLRPERRDDLERRGVGPLDSIFLVVDVPIVAAEAATENAKRRPIGVLEDRRLSDRADVMKDMLVVGSESFSATINIGHVAESVVGLSDALTVVEHLKRTGVRVLDDAAQVEGLGRVFRVKGIEHLECERIGLRDFGSEPVDRVAVDGPSVIEDPERSDVGTLDLPRTIMRLSGR